MKRLFTTFFGIFASCSAPPERDAKFLEVDSLPEGIVVVHSPGRGVATEGGRSGFEYTWQFATTVKSSTAKRVRIVEFGAFSRVGDQWKFANFTGKPFSGDDFSEWYGAPGAMLQPGQSYTDPQNWFGGNALKESESLWYFIGLEEDGRRVKGIGTCTHLAALR